MALDPKNLTNVLTFEIDMENKAGEKFQGKFTLHRPTVKETIQIGLKSSKILEGNMATVDLDTYYLAQMVATFEVIVDESPAWFKPGEMRDLGVLRAVFKHYADHLREFQGEPSKESTDNSTGATGQ